MYIISKFKKTLRKYQKLKRKNIQYPKMYQKFKRVRILKNIYKVPKIKKKNL